MTKLERKDICKAGIVLVLLLLAYLCRIPDFMPKYATELGLVRSTIYIGLFIAWGISLRERVIQTQERWYLTAIAVLMVFWFLVRTIKYTFPYADRYPGIPRYLWYLFYLPMLFIPLLSIFVVLLLGRPEDYRIPAGEAAYAIPTAALVLLVLTNDLHQFVFIFPEDAPVWMADDYSYGIGYYLVVVWLAICALKMFAEMYKRSRVLRSRRLILVPCIPSVLLLIYTVLYYLQFKWLRWILGDPTAVTCLLYAATLELCIRCGFIQANTHYQELFDASTVGAQIMDEEYRVFLSSKMARRVGPEVLRQTEKGPVMLDDGMRISQAPIHGGHVVWTEDMSPLLSVLEELREAKENLEDSNGILEEENAVRAREAHIVEQERLYNIIRYDTERQICLMDDLIRQVEEAGAEEQKAGLLQKMLVIGAYLKRRSNLVFLADKMSELDAKELDLTFGESMNNLEMCDVICSFYSELTDPVLAIHIMEMYDFFEEIVERSLGCVHSLTVCVYREDSDCLLVIHTDSEADFADLVSDTVDVSQDEDGEWRLVLRLCTGGENR